MIIPIFNPIEKENRLSQMNFGNGKKMNRNILEIQFQKQKENEWVYPHHDQIMHNCQIPQRQPNIDWEFFLKDEIFSNVLKDICVLSFNAKNRQFHLILRTDTFWNAGWSLWKVILTFVEILEFSHSVLLLKSISLGSPSSVFSTYQEPKASRSLLKCRTQPMNQK